jgi:hypothetical protein
MSAVWRALVDEGVEMTALDAEHVELTWHGRTARMLVRTSSRALKPSQVERLVGRHAEPGLLVMPGASDEVGEVVARACWSCLVADASGVRGVLRFGGIDVAVGERETGESAAGRGLPGRTPWGSFTVMRRLVDRPFSTQRGLADSVGMSQPRVSQILKSLAGKGVVERVDGAWMLRDFDELLDLWLAGYPGPEGVSTYWFGLDPPVAQAAAVMQQLHRSHQTKLEGNEPFAVVSGDVAADMIAPWRNPVRAVIYAHAGADLTEAGLSPVGADEATLELVVPYDSGVWPHPGSRDAGRTMPVADPLQIMWDLGRSPGSDRDEAVATFRESLRTRSSAARGTGGR